MFNKRKNQGKRQGQATWQEPKVDPAAAPGSPGAEAQAGQSAGQSSGQSAGGSAGQPQNARAGAAHTGQPQGHPQQGHPQQGHPQPGAAKQAPSRPDASAVLNRQPSPPVRSDTSRRAQSAGASASPQSGQPAASQAGVSVPADHKRLLVGKEISLSGEIRSCDTLVVEGTVEAELERHADPGYPAVRSVQGFGHGRHRRDRRAVRGQADRARASARPRHRAHPRRDQVQEPGDRQRRPDRRHADGTLTRGGGDRPSHRGRG
ncbi:MAG: hypothetical protein U5L06_15310 [Rhodovibrio sp.]|nr:hypothetical protein [Rhodovibrio sp.]